MTSTHPSPSIPSIELICQRFLSKRIYREIEQRQVVDSGDPKPDRRKQL